MKRGFVLAVVPARGGSKRLPGKNVRPLLGRELIAYAIECGKNAERVGATIVSTDSREIAEVARRHGAEVPFLRPKSLSTDRASSYDVLRHAVLWWEANRGPVDIAVLLQPTSPLRSHEDVDAALALLSRAKADAVVSVSPAEPPPWWMVTLGKGGTPRPVVRRPRQFVTPGQLLPPVYSLNGAIYALRRAFLFRGTPVLEGKTRCYVMPRERSVDIDHEEDFLLAEAMLRRHASRKGASRPLR